MKNKISFTQALRHIIQLVSFVAFPGLFIVILHSVSSIYQSILGGSFSLSSQASSLITLLAVIPVTVL